MPSDGHDAVRLVVTRNIYNQVLVQLQEINSATGSTDFLQSITLAPPAADDRIELDLSNNGAVNNGAITASFTLFNGNTVDSTTTFTQTGQVFVPENGVAQDWTQASFLAIAGGGIPTSLGGMMNSTLLAQDFGLTAIPIGESGGTNYAASGATVRNSLSGSLAPSINSQVASYLSSNGTANPNALYLVDGGGNDEKIADQLAPVQAQEYMIESANQLAADLVQLHAAGAQYIVIHDLGTGGADGSLGALFNATLEQDLATAGVPFVLEDFSSLIQKIDANPAAYGITNTVAPPIGPFTGSAAYNPDPATYAKGWSLEATQLTSPNAGQTNLWSDDEHLSAVGQAIEANYVYNLVENAVPTVGETLTANPTLTGSNGSTASIVYQWQSQLAGQAWNNIGGATGSTYLVQAGDLGANLRVVASFTDPATGVLVTTDSPATFAVVAASATWIPGVSGDWSNAADWTAGSAPASTSNVVLNNLTASPNTITIAISSSHSAQRYRHDGGRQRWNVVARRRADDRCRTLRSAGRRRQRRGGNLRRRRVTWRQRRRRAAGQRRQQPDRFRRR
jgi:phospholipase/lecithinase/hemolysin